MLNDLKLKKLSLFIIIPIILSFIILKAASNYKIYFIIDLLITILFLYIYSKNKKIIYLTPIIIIAFIAFIITNKSDKLVTITDYKTILENKSYDIENYINLDSSIYRTEDYLNGSYNINYSKAKNDYRITSYSSTTNPFYTKAFYNTFNNNDIYRNKFMLDETNNLFFEKFMGIKYLLTDKDAPYGYKKVVEYNNGTLYENNNVYPIGYATSHILNQEEYNNLEFNAQLEAFLNNIIVDDTSSNAKTDTESKKINLSYQIDSVNNLTYESNNDTYNIISKDNGNIKLKLDEEITDHILIIRFKINKAPSCKDGDIAITINNITNKLTCKTWKYYNDNETFDYVISSNDSIKELNIEFLKGTYQISDIAIYEIPKSFFDETNDIDTLNIDWNNTKGDDLSGNITVNDDGYFIFTIPYDKGFTIKVDGIDTPYTMVNDAFIGFKINKGTHNIKISYRSPLFKEGKIISLVAIILIAILTIYEKKRYN
jgi:uncharacterized membrane protein YfhO